MAILGRINRAIQSNLNDLLDSMSDPGKEVDLLIYDMEQGLKEAKQEVIAATAEGQAGGKAGRGARTDRSAPGRPRRGAGRQGQRR